MLYQAPTIGGRLGLRVLQLNPGAQTPFAHFIDTALSFLSADAKCEGEVVGRETPVAGAARSVIRCDPIGR